MAEDLVRISGTKDDIYKGLFPQIVALIGNEKDVVANLGNVSAALKEAFGFFGRGRWLGGRLRLREVAGVEAVVMLKAAGEGLRVLKAEA
jgi:putative methionine-R-sulfoxide reductase with GAF domain